MTETLEHHLDDFCKAANWLLKALAAQQKTMENAIHDFEAFMKVANLTEEQAKRYREIREPRSVEPTSAIHKQLLELVQRTEKIGELARKQAS